MSHDRRLDRDLSPTASAPSSEGDYSPGQSVNNDGAAAPVAPYHGPSLFGPRGTGPIYSGQSTLAAHADPPWKSSQSKSGHAAPGGPSTAPVASPDENGGMVGSPVTREVAGVVISAGATVHRLAIDRVVEIVNQLVGRNAYGQRRFRETHTTIVIIPAAQSMTALTQFSSLHGRYTTSETGHRLWDTVRGSGGLQAGGAWNVGVAEENLIDVTGHPSQYPAGYSIAMHELAHTLESKGMTDAQRRRLNDLFRARRDPDRADTTTHRDAFPDNYAATNVHEYFAQVTNTFFNRNVGSEEETVAATGGTAATTRIVPNNNGREWLRATDPEMYAFLVEMYETDRNAEGGAATASSPAAH